MRPIILTILLFFVACSSFAQMRVDTTTFREGDMIFQDIDCGALCNAIEKVTTSVNGYKFSHMGLVVVANDKLQVLEAIGSAVHLTPLQDFVNRQLDTVGRPKIVHARLLKKYRHLNKSAIRFALQQIGTPYDDAFLYNNGKYYCSELIYDAYKAANGGKPFFKLYPMTFIDPDTHQTFPAWVDYYKTLNTEIPEGKLGCNPGGVSSSGKYTFIKFYY